MGQEMWRGVASVVVAVSLSVGGTWALWARAQDEAQAKIAEQDEAIERLLVRVEALEQRRGQPEAAPSVVAQVRAEHRSAASAAPQAMAALDPMDPEVQPQVREAVQGMVRDELAIEREERRMQRAERLKERVREEVAEFAREAALDKESEEALAGHIAAEREAMMTLWGEARSAGLTPEETREKMEALRAATDQEVASLLDEEQYKLYAEKRSEEAARFAQRRGGRGQRGDRGASEAPSRSKTNAPKVF